jgi:hypothetical protein
MRKLHFCGGLFLLALMMLVMPSPSSAQIAVGVGISVHIGPPALPVYPQPICPGAGYLWTPGYWGYGDAGYYWVPGTWVMAPSVGLLWTPGYWGWGGGAYAWHAGYWGPHVGFYGGINYGFGYGGVGFVGGRWNGGVFAYNTAIMHVDTTVIHNTYVDRTVVHVNESHVAFNGGEGGIHAEPNAAERAAANEHHIEATHEQMQHEHTASTNRAMLASENHGRPAVAATSKPGEFSGRGTVAASAHAENANRPPNAGNRPPNTAASHTDRPPAAHSTNAADHPANNAHSNNNSSSKNQSHASSKSENKPAKESKPHSK